MLLRKLVPLTFCLKNIGVVESVLGVVSYRPTYAFEKTSSFNTLPEKNIGVEEFTLGVVGYRPHLSAQPFA